MPYNWDGIMELLGSKYRPTWSSLCGAADVKGVMELYNGKYRPKANAHGNCDEKPGIMVKNDEDKYFPRIVLSDEYECCAGVICIGCPLGIALGLTYQPYVVLLTISGVTACPECSGEDINGEYILYQYPAGPNPDYPCWYYNYSGNLLLRYCSYSESPALYSGVSIYNSSNNDWYFSGGQQLSCRTSFKNVISEDWCCAEKNLGYYGETITGTVKAYGGTAVISAVS